MGARVAHTALDASHASVPALLYAGLVAVTMLAVHPVVALASLAGALACSALTRGARTTGHGLVWQLPMLALVCLANPLFSARGSTLVAKWGTVSVYAESLAYGATMGAVMVAVVVWLECAARELTQDRLLSLMGGRARSLPLVTSMAAQLVPQLTARARTVCATQLACTAAGVRPPRRAALVRTSTMLMSWALEDSVGRADAMRARGWESGRARTCYRPDRLRRRDARDLALLGALVVAAAAGALLACASWRFYPRMPEPGPWWAFAPFALLAAVPALAELARRVREGRLA
ncbi:energy-coupling factor transporter transmembrane component T [Thermophilibacter sp.]